MPVTRNKKKAVVLLSGGLDSATTLYLAKEKGYKCLCLIFDYGQRHKKEISAAKRIAKGAKCPYRVIKFRLPWRGSALLDKGIKIPQRASVKTRRGERDIPATYVPARNIIFLSFAVSFAEASNAQAIFIGANAIDYSGYPDCRPQFYRHFIRAAQKGTKAGVSGKPVKILTPLIDKSKKEIIKTGARLKVPYRLTWSCYRGGKTPCGKCDSCLLRQGGFEQAGIEDPLNA
jgi:7-cyano-7-deazaguanine synthase